jgi:GTP-binding protein EngB required for normal cell division
MGTDCFPQPHSVFTHITHVASTCHLTSLTPQIETCQRLLSNTENIEVAVFGRFKAGKSSFLNSLAGMDVLPVGVVPVTSVITQLSFGEQQQVVIQYLDGATRPAALREVAEFVSEAQNPGNRKGVASVVITLPQLAAYKGVTFVDTPGVGSVFKHNTATARDWLARVAAAIVAVSIDPPLTDQDVQLIQELQRFTPQIVVLLTKADLLNPAELEEVAAFVHQQLQEKAGLTLAVLPFSIKANTAGFRETLDRELFWPLTKNVTTHVEQILHYKLASLLHQLTDYLEIARKAAETSERERQSLRQDLLGEEHEKHLLKGDILLIRNKLRAETRPQIMARFRELLPALQQQLTGELDAQLQQWHVNLWRLTRRFEEWLYQALPAAMTSVSQAEHQVFSALVENAQRAFLRLLASFQHRLAERVERVLGIRLTQPAYDLVIAPPQAPSISIGNVFDHHLDLLWFLIPMTIFGGLVKQHLRKKLPGALEKSLSRLATQWADRINAVIERMADESYLVIRSELSTIEGLLLHHNAALSEIDQFLDRTRELREGLDRLSADNAA